MSAGRHQGRGRALDRSDDIEAGHPTDYLADARCGLEWLGQVNDIWWRTEAPADAVDWVPDAWRAAVREDGMLPIELLLLTAGGGGADTEPVDDADLTDRPRLEATANGVTVIYRATMEAPPACG